MTVAGRAGTFVAVLACLVAVLLGSGTLASATGPGGWDHLGTGASAGSASLDGRVDALVRVPQVGQIPDSIYAGGVFTSAGGDAAAAMLARWDGDAWHSVAPVISTASGASVHAIAVDTATGNVYVGGNFVDAGGNANADFLAVWNGATWQPFCAPITANVNALQIIGRKLYIGGDFTDGAGIAAADRLVVCDMDSGTASSTVITAHAINGSVYTLAADAAGNLYAGGGFINMDASPQADYVAKYGGGAWAPMGSGPGPGGGAVDDFVRSITAYGTNVYIGTDSLNVGGVALADHVARWDGSAWHALGANTAHTNGWFSTGSAYINAMGTDAQGNLYVTGSFQDANGVATADEVAEFTGSDWAPLGSDGAGNGPLPGPGNALALFGGQVVVGGNFVTAGGDSRASYIARYPGLARPLTAVITLGGGGFSPFVGSTATFDSSASSGDEPIVAQNWHFTDGSPDVTTASVAHVLTKQGTNTVTLTVTDKAGHTAQTSEDFFISGQYPQARFSFAPLTVFATDLVAFDGTGSSDADGTISSYTWKWGDGGGGDSHAAKPTHAFTTPGTYHVSLIVSDDNEQLGDVIHDVKVLPLVVPGVSHASLSNKTFRVGAGPTAVTAAKAKKGTTLAFTLKAPAKVKLAFARLAPRVKGHKQRTVKAGTLTRSHLRNGKNVIAFSGRIGKRPLKPGSYVVTITASNAKGKAKAVILRFKVVK